MSGKDRVNLFPSRANLVAMKIRFAAASKGLNMLKRKRDALEMKIREIKAEILKADHKVYLTMHEAYNSMAMARFLGTDFKPATVINPERADLTLRTKYGRVVGVLLPTFTLILRPVSSFPLTGLARGGKQVQVVRRKFTDALTELIQRASLQFSEKTYELALRQTNMRVNAIDYVVLPKYQNTINYIRDELEEYEREDFYRLKRSQAKQRKNKEKFKELVNQLKVKRESALEDEIRQNKRAREMEATEEKSSKTTPAGVTAASRITAEVASAAEDGSDEEMEQGTITRAEAAAEEAAEEAAEAKASAAAATAEDEE